MAKTTWQNNTPRKPCGMRERRLILVVVKLSRFQTENKRNPIFMQKDNYLRMKTVKEDKKSIPVKRGQGPTRRERSEMAEDGFKRSDETSGERQTTTEIPTFGVLQKPSAFGHALWQASLPRARLSLTGYCRNPLRSVMPFGKQACHGHDSHLRGIRGRAPRRGGSGKRR